MLVEVDSKILVKYAFRIDSRYKQLCAKSHKITYRAGLLYKEANIARLSAGI
jgi:hypothetical protein